MRLHGPDQVTGLAPGQVLRSEPRPDSAEVEPTLFPYVELAAPDLPWLYTPAAPDGTAGCARGSCSSSCASRRASASSTRDGACRCCGSRRRRVAADELPDLADAWAWAHVQSLVGLDGIAEAVAAAAGEVVARLLCPRRLLARRAWLACVVPAFDGGVARRPGRARACRCRLAVGVGPRCRTRPRATAGLPPLALHDGREGDFETLVPSADRPTTAASSSACSAMDVSDPGLIDPFRKRVLLDFEGALRTPDVVPREWDAKHKAAFQPAVATAFTLDPARRRAAAGSRCTL